MQNLGKKAEENEATEVELLTEIRDLLAAPSGGAPASKGPATP